jgi:uncharacterized damage-inducible protein DinB
MSRLAAHFRAMARNNAWANDRLLEAVAMLSPQDFAAPRTSFFPDRLRADDLDRRVPTDRSPGTAQTERVDALLAHLFQHQIHHRGQAHAMLAGTEVPPPQLDEFFLDFDRHPSAGELGLKDPG